MHLPTMRSFPLYAVLTKITRNESKVVKLAALTKIYTNTAENAHRHIRYIPQGTQGTELKSERVIQQLSSGWTRGLRN